MPEAMVSVNVVERNAQVAQTRQGKPKLGIKTAAGKWLQITGNGVENIAVGQELLIAEPKQFGQQWFADLKEIKSAAAPSANGRGNTAVRYDSKPEKMPWEDFERTVRAAHAMIMDFEPDGQSVVATGPAGPEGAPSVDVVTIDRSAARATMLNTIVMALTKDGGRVGPTEKVPF